MFDTVTYKIDRIQKLKKVEDVFFGAVFRVFGFYRFLQRIMPWSDPFRHCSCR